MKSARRRGCDFSKGLTPRARFRRFLDGKGKVLLEINSTEEEVEPTEKIFKIL